MFKYLLLIALRTIIFRNTPFTGGIIMSNGLSQLKGKEKARFLKEKYRELLLIKKLDLLTDKYRVLEKLIFKSLKTLTVFFNCEIGAFMQGQNLISSEPRENDGFIFTSIHSEVQNNLKKNVKSILNGFLLEPRSEAINNNCQNQVKEAGLKNYVLVPMILRNEIEGAFFLGNRSKDFSAADAETLKSACSQLDNAVEFCRYVKNHREARLSLKRQKRELDILYSMSLSLNYGYEMETLFQKILENVMSLLKIDRASIMKYDQRHDSLNTITVIGEKHNCRLAKISMGKGIAGLVLASGKPIFAPLGSEDRRFIPFNASGLKVKKIYSFACIPLVAKDSTIGVINLSMLTPKKSIKPSSLETLSVAANMISLAFQRQEFYQMSIKDELTGLFSFRHFKERLADECLRGRRYKVSLSLIIFDLDHFKSINDTYGHPFGNVVLKEVAAILTRNIRIGVDIPARFGGEEMVVILPHTEAEGAQIVAERIRKEVEQLQPMSESGKVPITISGGIACFPKHSEDAETLLKKADKALYQAKEGGRNQIVTSDGTL